MSGFRSKLDDGMVLTRWILMVALLATLGLGLVACGGESQKQHDKRVIVLGVDGLDPDLLQDRIDRGLMPNFAKLVSSGTFQPLGTSWPPQSPVAWSNFITGCNPGKHGLYDFIHVDRATYSVATSMSESDPLGFVLNLFGYAFPLSGGESRLTRKFPAFWEVMDEADVPVSVYRMPANFPPAPTEAITYPDMGTPDLAMAASGKAFLWTEELGREKSGESYYIIEVEASRDRPGLIKVEDQVLGPENSLRNLDGLRAQIEEEMLLGNVSKVVQLRAELNEASTTFQPISFSIDTEREPPALVVEVDGQYTVAELGGWSDWLPVSFEMVPMVVTLGGQMRFLFKSADPFEVYGTPVQIDPFAPASPVSTPDDASANLAEGIGPYYTQGFPDAYKAYKVGLLDTGEFVSQSDTVLEERERMMEYALDEFEGRGGLLFFYTGSLDLRCHMLWHCQDDEHPHQEEDGSYDGVAYEAQIDRIYQQVDAMVGRLLERMQAWPDCELMIMSDHGFAPFRRKMHVNDWLVQEGYLVLQDDVELKDGEVWRDGKSLGDKKNFFVPPPSGEGEEPDWDASIVDWDKTKAYCIGFNGIILNRVGREPRGIVEDAEVAGLLAEMREKLMAMRDTDGGQVFTTVAPATEVFQGDQVHLAPDLQLGFNVGYGASDECAVGEITADGVLVDNDSRWSGSHLMDPELVKGTLVINRPRTLSREPRLEDLTATLYSLFSVTPPEGMDGEALY